MTEKTKQLRTVKGMKVSTEVRRAGTELDKAQRKRCPHGQYQHSSTKLHAHDEENTCNEGDLVRVSECRPLSKTKNWQVVEIITRAAQ